MIKSQSRAGYFGASDTSFIVGNMTTKTFKKWWLEKLGVTNSSINTKAMRVGNAFEHKILDTIPGIRKDHQVIIEDLKLRVNYDGDKDGTIYEVKTHKKDFKVTKGYWRQAQVEMFAYWTDRLYIMAYQVTDQEYKNYFTPIDESRITLHKIEYDSDFIQNEYLPRLEYLKKCLEIGAMPK